MNDTAFYDLIAEINALTDDENAPITFEDLLQKHPELAERLEQAQGDIEAAKNAVDAKALEPVDPEKYAELLKFIEAHRPEEEPDEWRTIPNRSKVRQYKRHFGEVRPGRTRLTRKGRKQRTGGVK